ncbi:MAG: sulfotransferase family protein [Gammaproteobacteria bacterium]|nr:MAG: sulfotransferase family protein [Gammaproteobacteria bacterium]
MKAICLWSGPRNVSTALMYSFAQRRDTLVVDEPLYGHFLRVTGTIHPGRNEVLATVNCDGDSVMRELLARQRDPPRDVLFMKQMAHHLVDIDRDFMRKTHNIFLVRDPRQMLPSLMIQMPHAKLANTGLETQWHLYRGLTDAGQQPAILDSRELLLDPGTVLEKLCAHLEIPYTDDMLSWPAGARPEDGIWAPHWYHAVHRSTGFSVEVAKDDFPERLEPLLAECKPWYDKLYEHAIRADTGE